jgi:succinate dehydrogenase / fumarate reductase, iron-sulfur subunit
MVAFSLPQNSKIQPGKVHPMPVGSNIRSFKIYRWNGRSMDLWACWA